MKQEELGACPKIRGDIGGLKQAGVLTSHLQEIHNGHSQMSLLGCRGS